MKIPADQIKGVENDGVRILATAELTADQIEEISDRVKAQREVILESLKSKPHKNMKRVEILIDGDFYMGFSAELPEKEDNTEFKEAISKLLTSAANLITAPKIEGFPKDL